MKNRMITDLLEHLEKISRGFKVKNGKVVACIAGGTAVNFYTGSRMSDDTDIEWSCRVLLSKDEQSFMTEDLYGNPSLVTVDAGFSESIGLFHPDWKKDAEVLADYPNLTIKIITPIDLIVSKIGRFVERDRDDIRDIASAIPIDADAVRLRAEEAMGYYIGNEEYVKTSLFLALEIIRECSKDDLSCQT